jgi:hypothetical protein
MALAAPGNRQGNWIFRIVHGRPPQFPTALRQLSAARLWVLLWTSLVTLSASLIFRSFAPREFQTVPATLSLLFIGAGLCLLLTDAFFLNVRAVAFSGEPEREQSNLAMTVLKYCTFFPAVIWLSG